MVYNTQFFSRTTQAFTLAISISINNVTYAGAETLKNKVKLRKALDQTLLIFTLSYKVA